MNKQDIRFNEDTEKFGGQYPQGFMQVFPVTADANLAQEIGQYGTQSTTLNLPPGTEQTGTLLVQAHSDVGSQIYIPYNHNSVDAGVWVRAWQNDSAWLAWEKLGGDNTINPDDFAVRVSTTLDDCNNALIQGMYYTGDTTVNIPIAGQWGGLYVSGNDHSIVTQLHINHAANSIHMRAFANDAWSSWEKLGTGGGTSIPIGGIIMYSGSFAGIPADWALCDGNNGTPNLIGRFVIGTNTETNLGVIGGSANSILPSHTHTASASSSFAGAALPTHSHTLIGVDITDEQGEDGVAFSYDKADIATVTCSAVSAGTPSGTVSTSVTVNAGGVDPTNGNMPPYYTLAYIIKIA